MYIELYLDILFFLNFFLNYLLLRSVQVLTGKPSKRVRCMLGSAVGAFGVCTFVCLPIHITYVNLLPVHVVTSTLMVKIGCKIKDAKDLGKSVAALYFTGFLWGGMFLFLYQNREVIRLRTFLFLSVLFYELLVWSVGMFRRQQKHRERYCEVTLYVKEKSKKVRGLYDTGNQLTDPFSKCPVSVVDEQILQELFRESGVKMEELKPHYIPYRAVGTAKGALLTVTVDAMEIQMRGQSCRIVRPVLAVSKESVSFTRHYQLILNPDLIDS